MAVLAGVKAVLTVGLLRNFNIKGNMVLHVPFLESYVFISCVYSPAPK